MHCYQATASSLLCVGAPPQHGQTHDMDWSHQNQSRQTKLTITGRLLKLMSFTLITVSAIKPLYVKWQYFINTPVQHELTCKHVAKRYFNLLCPKSLPTNKFKQQQQQFMSNCLGLPNLPVVPAGSESHQQQKEEHRGQDEGLTLCSSFFLN